MKVDVMDIFTDIKKNYSLCLIPGIISPTVSTLLTGCTIRK